MQNLCRCDAATQYINKQWKWQPEEISDSSSNFRTLFFGDSFLSDWLFVFFEFFFTYLFGRRRFVNLLPLVSAKRSRVLHHKCRQNRDARIAPWTSSTTMILGQCPQTGLRRANPTHHRIRRCPSDHPMQIPQLRCLNPRLIMLQTNTVAFAKPICNLSTRRCPERISQNRHFRTALLPNCWLLCGGNSQTLETWRGALPLFFPLMSAMQRMWQALPNTRSSGVSPSGRYHAEKRSCATH